MVSLPRCWLQAPLTDSLYVSTHLSGLKGKKCLAFTVLLILRLQLYLCTCGAHCPMASLCSWGGSTRTLLLPPV